MKRKNKKNIARIQRDKLFQVMMIVMKRISLVKMINTKTVFWIENKQ